jgi:hypothetical protein
VVHIFVGEPSSYFFGGQFAWWFTLGLAGFAQLTVGYVVRCDVGVSQHSPALRKGKSAFELGAWFGLLALGTGLNLHDDRSSPLGCAGFLHKTGRFWQECPPFTVYLPVRLTPCEPYDTWLETKHNPHVYEK